MLWLITFSRNAFDALEISADIFGYICDVKFEIHTWVEHHVIGTRGNSRLNKGQSVIKQVIPLEKIPTRWSTDVLKLCRICHFYWKGQCTSEIQLLNIPHVQLHCRHEADDTGLVQFGFICSVSYKKWQGHFHDQVWRWLRYLVALDSNFKFLLMSSILEAMEKNWGIMLLSGSNKIVCGLLVSNSCGCYLAVGWSQGLRKTWRGNTLGSLTPTIHT